MASGLGMLIESAFMLLWLLLKILFKLRILPAVLFLAITQIWFVDWANRLGEWYNIIAIALAAVALGSFVVQGIVKLRNHFVVSKLEKEYEAKQERKLIDELYRSGRITRINTIANREELQ